MIDFIKVYCYIQDIDAFLKISNLNFIKKVNNDAEIILNEANENGLKFKLFNSGRLEVSGSIHKYYNHLQNIKGANQNSIDRIQKGFNGNDYNFKEIEYSLKYIEKTYSLPLKTLLIENIEFGLNIKHSFDTSKILNGLMLHKGQKFKEPLMSSYRQCEHNRYKLKIYDKSLQYGLKENVIRIEIKYVKMIDLKTINIINLNDLISYKAMYNLFKKLMFEFDKIIFYDYTIDKERLTPFELQKTIEYSNTLYWTSLKANRRDKPKKHLDRLILKNSKNIKTQLEDLCIAKFNQLIKSV